MWLKLVGQSSAEEIELLQSLSETNLITLCVSRYCTLNYLITLESDQSCYVVFITKLSRIQSGGSQYIGFQGGELQFPVWQG